MRDNSEMPVKRRQSAKKKSSAGILGGGGAKLIGMIAVVVVAILAVIFGIKGCSVKQNTPQNVVKSMINFAYEGNAKKVKKCYDLENSDVDQLDRENEALIKYLQVHNSKSIEIVECDSLYSSDQYDYVFITYNLVLEDGQKYPCIGTYIVREKEDKFYIVPSSCINDEMSSTAVEKYNEFTKERPYKTYLTTYDTFIKKNPGYEEKIADKLK